MANKQRRSSSTHIASAIAWKIEFIRKVRRAAPAHVAMCRLDVAKSCKNQCADKPLRPKGASERQFALSCRHSQSPSPPCLPASCTSFGNFVAEFSGSPIGLEISSDGIASFLGKGNKRFRSAHVACYRSAFEAKRCRRKHDLSTTGLTAMSAPFAVANVQNICGIPPETSDSAAQKATAEAQGGLATNVTTYERITLRLLFRRS
jgi:hypothetical protein